MMRSVALLPLLFACANGLALEVTDANFDKVLEGKDAFLFMMAPWCGHCRKLQPDWDKLSKEYKETPNVVIAQMDCNGPAQQKCGQLGAQGYPTLKIMKSGKSSDYNGGRDFGSLKREVETKLNPKPACSLESKDACSKEDRAVLEESEKMSKAERAAKIKETQKEIEDSKTQIKELEKKIKTLGGNLDLIKAGGATVEKVEQLLNDEDWKAHCEGRTCVVAFLPHIYDDNAKGRQEKIKVLDDVLKETKKDGKSIGFLWSQGGDQFDLEEKLGLQFGFPAVIAVNFGKGRFGVHRGTYDVDSIKQFLTSLSRGGTPLAPVPNGAKASKADAWDGKDAAPPSEDL